MKKINSIHFVGIKGVGITPLAIIAKEAGMNVTGSDTGDTFITDDALTKVGITNVFDSFSAEHVGSVDLVVTTVAHEGLKNPEVIAAKEKDIPVWTQAQAVGEFMKGEIFGTSFTGISITGTHGKTTTTGMIATMLQYAKLDPSYIIGTSAVSSLHHDGETGLPGHLGKGNFFVAEADEYVGEYEENGVIKMQTKFLWQHPKFMIMTNMEFDHPDVYPDIASIRESFLQFAKQLPADGILIFNGDDENLQKIAKEVTCRKITYGFDKANDFSLDQKLSKPELKNPLFALRRNGVFFANLSLQVHGEHNALNALSAVCLGSELGLSPQNILEGLASFTGSKRRLEKVIPTNDVLPKEVLYYDDYAHHPTEIKATLRTIRSMYPDYFVVCIFQPHTYSRTKALFHEFSHAFDDANEVILTDIFSSAREQADPDVSSSALADAIEKSFYAEEKHDNKAVYKGNLSHVVEYIGHKQYPQKTIIVTMGAGDVYTILS